MSDPASSHEAAQAARRWRAAGLEVVAARARCLPRGAVDAFDALGLDEGVAPLLPVAAREALMRAAEADDALQRPLAASVEAWTSGGVALLSPALSGPIEPGVLDLADIGEFGRGEGATPVSLERLRGAPAPRALCGSPSLSPEARVLLFDVGGDPNATAEQWAARGRLAAYFGPAHRALPDAAAAGTVLVHRYFEPEDVTPDALSALEPARGWACAWAPFGLPDDTVDRVRERLRALRQAGYAAVAPRIYRPTPNTAAWSAWSPHSGDPDTGPHGQRWQAQLKSLLDRAVSENRPPPLAHGRPHITTTLDRLQSALKRPISAPREALERALVESARATSPTDCEALAPLDAYPFAAWGGVSVLNIVEDALRGRLAALRDVDADLHRAMTHIASAPGKRLRPVLAIVQAAGRGIPPSQSMPAALAIEWLHAASLMQDDLPCMDDEPQRRGGPSAHARHGEGLALLGSDALVALAFEDVAAMADDPAVGPARAAALARAFAAALGARGLVGGQARDLALRGAPPTDLAAVLEAHRGKTAPLFRLTATVAAVLGGDTPAERAEAEASLEAYGLAFQIVDDWLDMGDALARPAGSDARQRRASAATALTRTQAQTQVDALLKPLLNAVSPALTRLAAQLVARLDPVPPR
ncbi:MAG: polyprenyl synthetase family protein [Bradymonadia bacterium]